MHGMKNFRFNRLYVIQSLPIRYNDLGGEKIETGEELYNDLLRWKECQFKELKVFLKKINTVAEWDSLMAEILKDCLQTGNIPMIHLEIHGRRTDEPLTDSLILSNGTALSIHKIGNQFREINIACGFNLFVTLAVCKGMSLLLNMHLSEPMPFVGAIGSFKDLYEDDLIIRYTDFYTTFFDTFDIAKAYVSLMKANPGSTAEYRYISADELFIRNYQNYINEKCTREAIKERAKDSEPLLPSAPINRAERRRFQKLFGKSEYQHRPAEYRKAYSSFFCLDLFPENKERFDIPLTLAELKEKAKHLITV